ncbi:MAG: sodium/glutamate symporter [Burkholderiaceae bacterium]|nr:sodium/glutamate symporter [Burkholderiaceae bacterium]
MLALDIYGTLVAAALVLLSGTALVRRLTLLRDYSIPEPVAGGLVVAIGLALARAAGGVEVSFDMSLSPPLMLAFFACIGLNADIASLRQGGKSLAILCVGVIAFLFLQNGVGLAVAVAFGLDPLIGLLAGSITLSGGHGTGAAWSEVFSQKYGLTAAKDIALACATFGLILGGLIGGPVGGWLIGRLGQADRKPLPGERLGSFDHPHEVRMITAPAMIETLALIAICLLVGQLLARELKGTALELPSFVTVLFTGVLLRNGLSLLGWYTVFERAVSVLGNVSLALFLAMALMSLRLWELSSLALPLVALLTCQTVMMAAYAAFVTFRVMGRNYDAAVISAGHCGFGLGGTPTAITNMQALTDRYGASTPAFLVVPMVGAFFIDIANAIVIQIFLAIPGVTP